MKYANSHIYSADCGGRRLTEYSEGKNVTAVMDLRLMVGGGEGASHPFATCQKVYNLKTILIIIISHQIILFTRKISKYAQSLSNY